MADVNDNEVLQKILYQQLPPLKPNETAKAISTSNHPKAGRTSPSILVSVTNSQVAERTTPSQESTGQFVPKHITYKPSDRQNEDDQPLKRKRITSITSLLKRSNVRYFVMKCKTHDNLEIALDKQIWATQPKNEQLLHDAYKNGEVVLIFSVNSSGHFQAYGRMASGIGAKSSRVWQNNQRILGGLFRIELICVKNLPFHETEHLINPLNENKPVKISRDGQELPGDLGLALCTLLDSAQESNLSHYTRDHDRDLDQEQTRAKEQVLAASERVDTRKVVILNVKDRGDNERPPRDNLSETKRDIDRETKRTSRSDTLSNGSRNRDESGSNSKNNGSGIYSGQRIETSRSYREDYESDSRRSKGFLYDDVEWQYLLWPKQMQYLNSDYYSGNFPPHFPAHIHPGHLTLFSRRLARRLDRNEDDTGNHDLRDDRRIPRGDGRDENRERKEGDKSDRRDDIRDERRAKDDIKDDRKDKQREERRDERRERRDERRGERREERRGDRRDLRRDDRRDDMRDKREDNGDARDRRFERRDVKDRKPDDLREELRNLRTDDKRGSKRSLDSNEWEERKVPRSAQISHVHADCYTGSGYNKRRN